MNKLKKTIKPGQILVLGFLVMIFLGGFLLWLPISSADGTFTPFLDCLFTSTSASCVTGLTTINTAEHWSIFGKIVILALIQVGGLGFITLFITVLMVTGRRITLNERRVFQQTFNLTKHSGIVRFVRFLMTFTVVAELGGALLLALRFMVDYPPLKAIGFGIFHAISAFCNAGFDIVGTVSLSDYAQDFAINIVIIALVITGGVGFPVWIEFAELIRNRNRNKTSLKYKLSKLSLHTKLVLTSTVVLLVLGNVATLCFEFNNPKTIGTFTAGGKVLASFFYSVVLRTAGFFTISSGGLNSSTKFISVILMMIGGSPCGTAGGIKTIPIAVVAITAASLLKEKDSVHSFKRSISLNVIQKSLAVIALMLSILVLSTTVLSITEANMPFEYEFLDLLYEVSSALGTVGSSVGLTPYLSIAGKINIMICMFIGRLGPITIAISFLTDDPDKNKIHYPQENVLVG